MRNVWMVVHRWIGLIGLIAMFILAVTGSALVWPDATERLFHGDRFEATAKFDEERLDEYAATALNSLPSGDRLSAMNVAPVETGRSILFGGKPHPSGRVGPPPRYRSWLDPGSGEVTSSWSLAPDGMWYMHALHGHFAIPHWGRELVGIFGLLLVVSAISGLWIWWPRNGKILKALKWKRAPDFNSNLHHMMGFWSAIPMAVLGFTGAYIVFPAILGTFVLLATGNLGGETGGRDHEAEPPVIASAETTTLLPSEAAAAARAAGGGGQLIFMSWPTQERPVWMVNFDCAATTGTCQRSVLVDDKDGATTIPHDDHQPTVASDVADLMLEVHAGHVGGIIWQLLVFLSGIVLAVLSVTGVIMWASKRQGRIRVKKLRAQRA